MKPLIKITTMEPQYMDMVMNDGEMFFSLHSTRVGFEVHNQDTGGMFNGYVTVSGTVLPTINQIEDVIKATIKPYFE